MPARPHLIALLLWLISPTTSRSADLNDSPETKAYISPSKLRTSAVDAAGVRHYSRDYPGVIPWETDRIVTVAPQYPLVERQLWREGEGIATIKIDLNSGYVTNVTMLKSTGFRLLDDAAIVAFRQWRWKPRRWQEVETPIRFQMHSRAQSAEAPPANAKLLPRKAPYEKSGLEFEMPYHPARPLTSEYLQGFGADFRDQWYGLVSRRNDLKVGSVRISFSIRKNGKVQNLKIVPIQGGDEKSVQLARDTMAFAQSRLKPFSPALIKETGGEITTEVTLAVKD